MRQSALVLLALLGTGCAAGPTEPARTPDKAPVPAAMQASAKATAEEVKTVRKDGTEVICRREPVPNTRLGGQKVCLTREEWDQRASLASEAWREQQRSAMPEVGD